MMNALFAVVAIAVPLLAGCGSVNTQVPALIEYQRSGGIAGRTDRLVINGDGSARLYGRAAAAEFTVPADTLARLRALLEGIPFDSLRAEYLAPRRGADLFEYAIVYGNRRVRTMDTAIPPELTPLIALLDRLVARRG